MKSSDQIAAQSREQRKDNKTKMICQESELEKQLLQLFIAARDAERKINRR